MVFVQVLGVDYLAGVASPPGSRFQEKCLGGSRAEWRQLRRRLAVDSSAPRERAAALRSRASSDTKAAPNMTRR